jgi:PPOX class probable F420-dependent enzyme
VHAHLSTINREGWPQTSLVWVVYEEGELRMASLTIRQKLRNVMRDPRVSISWESPERDKVGLPYYLVVRGRGHVTEGGAAELVRRISPRFIGLDVKYPRREHAPEEGYILHIQPEWMFGYGPWADNT